MSLASSYGRCLTREVECVMQESNGEGFLSCGAAGLHKGLFCCSCIQKCRPSSADGWRRASSKQADEQKSNKECRILESAWCCRIFKEHLMPLQSVPCISRGRADNLMTCLCLHGSACSFTGALVASRACQCEPRALHSSQV